MTAESTSRSEPRLLLSLRQHWIRVVIVTVAALIVFGVVWWYVSLPWEWSNIDDPGFVLSLESEISQNGFLGYLTHVWFMINVDLTWGLFRPSYWLYPSLVYGFPIGIAHLIRLALLLLAIVGPIVAFRRRGADITTLVMGTTLIVISGRFLFEGLFFVSLQELSGAAFVGIGLIVKSNGGRITAWTVAAWFKSPFSWLLVGEAVALWIEGKRRQAVVSGSIGLGTLVTAYVFARTGSYTSGYSLDYGALWRAWNNVPRLLELGTAFTFVALLWWLITTSTRLRMDRRSAVLGFGWLGYTAHLLPWGVTGNYAAAISYLLALFLFSLLTSPQSANLGRKSLALALPVLLAMLSLNWYARDLHERNATAKGITQCILTSSSDSVFISQGFGIEAVRRVEEKVRLRDEKWNGSVRMLGADNVSTGSTGILFVYTRDDLEQLESAPTRPVCSLPRAVAFDSQ